MAILLWSLLSLLTVASGTVPPFQLAAMTFSIGGALGAASLMLRPGAMPLLSHALAETWQRRDGRVLTVEAYRATGEIRGAVARSADRLYESLPADQRPKLRSVLLRLVSPAPNGEPVRARVPTRVLGGDADRERLLGLLVRARLVTAEEDTVELAHEALARAWPRLRSWLQPLGRPPAIMDCRSVSSRSCGTSRAA
jgi:hypothetical protein